MSIEKKVEEAVAEAAGSPRPRSEIGGFLSDIEPFFFQIPLVYVDVGAHRGDVFREVVASGLRLLELHLIEPRPAAFAALRATVAASSAASRTTCHQLALGDTPGRLALRERGTMTQVITPAEREAGNRAATFEAESTTLDELAPCFPDGRISLLKIDVEGYEKQVLAGASELLAGQKIDMIYIEAGMDPGSNQQTYYRVIEDMLRGHGYRLFRIYEQTHEWLDDSPMLRRVNLAFMSEEFGRRHPFRLSRELVSLRKDRRGLQQALKTESARVQKAELRVAALSAELARQLEESAAQAAGLAALLDRRQAEIERLRDAARRGEERESELAELRRHAKDLERAQLRLLRSRSWRITEPLRRLARAVRGSDAGTPFEPRMIPPRNGPGGT